MAKDNNVGLDLILEQLGPFGKYNILNYALLLFPIYLAGMYGSVYVFEASDISYRCHISECEHLNGSSWLNNAIPSEEKDKKCKRYRFVGNISEDTCRENDFDRSIVEECHSIEYSHEDSAVKDFDLGCQDWKRTLIGSIHNAGLFVSLPVTGIVSDRYGRRVALAVASLMNGIFGFLRSFSTNYVMMLIFEFLEAGLGAGAYSTAFVLAVELVGPKGRVFGNTIINAIYVLGLMTLAGLAWWLQSWRTLLKVIYTPAIFVLSYLWILNESVRWLLSKGRNHEATQILKKAAIMNKVELSEELLAPLHELQKSVISDPDEKEKELAAQSEKTKEEETSTFRKVYKSSIIRKRVLVCSFLWITCTFVYYGFTINSVSLVGNIYVNFMLVTFVEIPANVVCLLILDRFGRKRTLVSTYILCGCLCIGLSFVPKDQQWWALILFLSGKFSITVAYSSVYIYVSEVFPTNVRQSLLAVCSSFGRIGSTMAPLTPLLVSVMTYAINVRQSLLAVWSSIGRIASTMAPLALYYDKLPAIFFGSLALIASIAVFTLPETINKPLPDTIEEAEMLSKGKESKEIV